MKIRIENSNALENRVQTSFGFNLTSPTPHHPFAPQYPHLDASFEGTAHCCDGNRDRNRRLRILLWHRAPQRIPCRRTVWGHFFFDMLFYIRTMALSARKGQIVLVQRQQSSVTVSVGRVVWREYDQLRQEPLVTRLLEAPPSDYLWIYTQSIAQRKGTTKLFNWEDPVSHR